MTACWDDLDQMIGRHDRHAPSPATGRLPAELLLFDGERCRYHVIGRPDRPREGVDPMSELAVLAAASGSDRAALGVPIRRIDVADGSVVDQRVLVTTLVREDAGAVELRARTLGSPGMLGASEVDGDTSPVASLLYDALALTAVPMSAARVAAVLEGWGHDVLLAPQVPVPSHAERARDRYRVHRLARELAGRHDPTAPAQSVSRPAVPSDLPPGFEPACPF